ncbi:hypothetical protein R5R35_007399 [Gryllus longicercus]|uniref:Uncharacterized protein n=1 Tax=Gryllus longicercus TaxID=2509291 RepID=A0AAN9VM56_9ORTH
MASYSPSGMDGASGTEVAVALVNVVQRMVAEAARLQVQEALRLQEQEAQRRLQEAVGLQVQEAQRRLQEALRLQEERAAAALRQMEQQLQERDSVISALRRSLDERVLRVEVRVAAVEERVRSSSARRESEGARGQVELQERDYAARTRQIEPVEETMRPSSARRESEGAAEQGALGRLESRMWKLEGGVQRALATVFPRVETLVKRLETSPPGAPLSPSAASASTSSALQPPAARGALGASATEEADEEDRSRQQLWRRLNELETRRRASRSAPSDLGEALCNATCADEVRDLLDSGADVNYTNTSGKCPLISAIDLITDNQSGEEMVSLLLARGADANSIDMNGSSALHLVSGGENFDLLIAAGADVDARNWVGATPLHIAVDWDDVDAVRTLVAAGANQSLRVWSGPYEDKTPLDLATSHDIRDLLLSDIRWG